MLTWSYVSPGFRAGLVLSTGAVLMLLLLLAAARWPRLGIRRPERMPAGGALLDEPPAERQPAGVS
jgi:hypothetical protein